ncbi:MAG: hypothetical protein WDA16_09855 [Candidatus Thermoplasmatota archaeon]
MARPLVWLAVLCTVIPLAQAQDSSDLFLQSATSVDAGDTAHLMLRYHAGAPHYTVRLAVVIDDGGLANAPRVESDSLGHDIDTTSAKTDTVIVNATTDALTPRRSYDLTATMTDAVTGEVLARSNGSLVIREPTVAYVELVEPAITVRQGGTGTVHVWVVNDGEAEANVTIENGQLWP